MTADPNRPDRGQQPACQPPRRALQKERQAERGGRPLRPTARRNAAAVGAGPQQHRLDPGEDELQPAVEPAAVADRRIGGGEDRPALDDLDQRAFAALQPADQRRVSGEPS